MTNWEEYAKKGDLRAVIDPADEKGHKNRYINLLHHKVLKKAIGDGLQGRSVLDLGCGNGRFYDLLKDCGASQITGIDSCYEMMKHYPGKALHASATQIPFPDGSFDAVLSVWTLQHLDLFQLRHAISEISRVLKPEGTVYIIEQMSLKSHDGVCGRKSSIYRYMFSEKGFETKTRQPIMYGDDLLVGIIRHGFIPEFLNEIVSTVHLSTTSKIWGAPLDGYLDTFMEFKR